MPFACVLLCCVIASSLFMAEGADVPLAPSFQEGFGEDALERWLGV